MSSKQKKHRLFELLNKAAEPMTAVDLLDKLGEDVSARTIRRWLSEMVEEGLLLKTGNKKGTRYQLIQNENKIILPSSSCFGSASKKIIQKIKRPIYERHPVSYEELWLRSYKPNETHYLSKAIQKQLEKAGRRASIEDPAGTFARQIFNRLLIDLSYNSSRLEGNTYSLIDTQKLLLEGTGAEGKLEEEKIMILNHKEAIRFLVDNAFRLNVTEETIRTVHFLLSDGLVDNRYAGKIRDYGVRIGGSSYIPFEDKKLLQGCLEKIIEKASTIKNPYEQSFFLLVHISYLQAFCDVNKRTARLCANIPLIKSNLVPLSFNDVEKDDYINAVIAIYELQEIQPLLDLYIYSYLRTCSLYDATVKALGFDEIRVRYREQRREVIRNIIINKLYGEKLGTYINDQKKLLIKDKDQELFLEDVIEDLRELDVARITGLGITPDQLLEWKKLQKPDQC